MNIETETTLDGSLIKRRILRSIIFIHFTAMLNHQKPEYLESIANEFFVVGSEAAGDVK